MNDQEQEPQPGPPDAAQPAEPVPVLPVTAPAPGDSSQVLSYAVPGSNREVTIARVAGGAEAEMISGQLAAAGIPSQVINRNVEVLGPYAPGSSVKVIVMADDVERAKEVLRDEVEPGEDPEAPLDDDGQPVELAVLASFDQPRLLRQAAATLASARVKPFLPTLVPRSQCAPGPACQGKRFVLRVRADDLDRARALLDEPDEDDDGEPEPRCPKCDAWRVHRNTTVMEEIGRFFGFGRGRQVEYECLKCRHRGPEADFLAARGS
jgi:hypothetical protein